MTETVAKHVTSEGATPGRIVLVLQGGGALGAYQAGVYQALEEAGLRPGWVVGTSIGAINSGIIAGNPVADRLDRLAAFWKRISYGAGPRLAAQMPMFGAQFANWMTMAAGLNSFFKPNPLAWAGAQWPMGPEQAGYYSTEPLRETLSELIDFERVNAGGCRLTVGAANVRTAEMQYFDSRDRPLDIRHVMASGALPPAFPAVRIGDDLFWDGGILSNTPVEAVFDDYPRRSALVFVVHVWNPDGPAPGSIQEVMHRQKDLQYSSRAKSHIVRQQQLHHMRHIVSELAARLPEAERSKPEVQELADYGCLTQLHVVRLMAPSLDAENHTKDIDFHPDRISQRWQAGYANTRDVVARAPWTKTVDPVQGFVLHEAADGRVVS